MPPPPSRRSPRSRSSLSELLDVSSEEIEIVSVKRGSILVEVRLAAHLEARLASLSPQELASFVATVQTTYEARKASGVALGEPLAAPETGDDLQREVGFYNLTLGLVKEGRRRLAEAGGDEAEFGSTRR